MGIRVQIGRISLWRTPTALLLSLGFRDPEREALWQNQNAAENHTHLGQDALAFCFALHHQSRWHMWLQFASSFKSSWNGTCPRFMPKGEGGRRAQAFPRAAQAALLGTTRGSCSDRSSGVSGD